MDIALKNVKHAAFMSQETDCFEASVYINGKKAGTVSNDGHGGCNLYFPNTLYQALHDHCKTIPTDMSGRRITPDEIVGNLFETWMIKRERARMCKGRTVFRIPGREYREGEWSVAKVPFSDAVRAKYAAHFGAGIEFMNDQLGGA